MYISNQHYETRSIYILTPMAIYIYTLLNDIIIVNFLIVLFDNMKRDIYACVIDILLSDNDMD